MMEDPRLTQIRKLDKDLPPDAMASWQFRKEVRAVLAGRVVEDPRLAQIRALDTFDVSVWGEPGSPFANGAGAMLRQVRAVLGAPPVDVTPPQGIDRDTLGDELRSAYGVTPTEATLDAVLALVRPVEGIIITPEDVDRIDRAIVRGGWTADPADQALAARLEASS